MASPSLAYPKTSFSEDRPVHPVHMFVLLIVSLGALAWGAILVTGHEGTSFQDYLLLLGFFGLASAAFVFVRVHRNPLRLFGLPVFITLFTFIRFGLAPLYSFAHPDALSVNFMGQYRLLVKALLLMTLGMVAFWLGSACLGRTKQEALRQAGGASDFERTDLRGSILFMAVGLYGVVFAAKLYLLHAHLLSYTMSWKAYYRNLASLQVLEVIGSLGWCVLIILAIERYSHPSDSKRKVLFVSVFLSECAWGLIGGDKGSVLENIFLIALVSSVIQRKVRNGWLLAPILGLVLFYPLSNSYRVLLRRNGGATSVAAASSGLHKALSQAAQKQDGLEGWVESGWRSAAQRLDLLQNVGLVLSLGPRAALLRGRERWWMVPYYPFIPRFIWGSKPVQDEGAKFSVALGYGNRTSTAVTYPGDLYARYGLAGIVAGMFLLGMMAEWLAQNAGGTLDKRRLFLYASVFPIVVDMEMDAFGFWTTFTKMFVIFSVIAFVVYGPHRRFHTVTVRKSPIAT